MNTGSINWTSILIYLAVFGAGYLFAFLDRRVTGAMKNKKKPEKEVRFIEEQSTFSITANDQQPMQIKLDGARITRPEDVTPEQRRRLVGLLTQLRPWLDASPVSAPAQAPRQSQTVEAAKPAPKSPEPTKKAAAAEPPPPATSIVGQIDEVLKRRTLGTPLEGKVRLSESSDGGVVVWAGGKHYDGIDALPDAEMQAAIRAAITEWEKGPQEKK
jgi:hypothetical protein